MIFVRGLKKNYWNMLYLKIIAKISSKIIYDRVKDSKKETS